MSGWIKLHRKFCNWGWSSKPEMVALFIRLLLEANYEEKCLLGHKIGRGQVIFGRSQWSETLGISPQSLRTCLERLKSTSEITIKTTNKFSIITIVNYEEYQSEENLPTSKSTRDEKALQSTVETTGKNPQETPCGYNTTKNQPAECLELLNVNQNLDYSCKNNQLTTNQQLTTLKEYKNIRKEKEPSNEGKKKIGLEELSVEHNLEWLSQKRAAGKYLAHDEHFILEQFKQYCLAKGKKYADYLQAYRNAFEWDKCQPNHRNQPKQTKLDFIAAGIAEARAKRERREQE